MSSLVFILIHLFRGVFLGLQARNLAALFDLISHFSLDTARLIDWYCNDGSYLTLETIDSEVENISPYQERKETPLYKIYYAAS